MAKGVFNFIDSSSSLKRKRVHLESSEDLDLCIICQTTGDLHEGTEKGLEKIKEFASMRHSLGDTKYQHAIDRIDRVIELAMAGSLTLLWHRKCYSYFTHKGKVERLQKSLQQTSCSSSVSHFGEKQLASRRTSGPEYVEIGGPCQI